MGDIGRPRKELDIEEMLDLYINKNNSVRQVALKMGVSHDTIAKRIVEKIGTLRKWHMPGDN
jgi:transcriptional regulator of aromatic amino acid metabolism